MTRGMRCESESRSSSRDEVPANESTTVGSPVVRSPADVEEATSTCGRAETSGRVPRSVFGSGRSLEGRMATEWALSDAGLEEEETPRSGWSELRDWLNGLAHKPSVSTNASLEKLRRDCGFPCGIIMKAPGPNQRPWTPPQGYICMQEDAFRRCGLWFPLPRLLIAYCARRRIAISQLSSSGIRNIVAALLLGAEAGVEVTCRLFEYLTKINHHKDRDGTYSVSALPGCSLTSDFSSKLHKYKERYFYVKLSADSIFDEDHPLVRRTWNPNYGTAAIGHDAVVLSARFAFLPY